MNISSSNLQAFLILFDRVLGMLKIQTRKLIGGNIK